MTESAKTKLDLICEKSFANDPFAASEVAEKNAADNRMECLSRHEKLTSTPVRVRLELTNKCNLNCVFCYRAHFRTDDRSLLTPEDIDRLDPVLKSAKHISLSQKAESTMSPHLIPILEKMAAYDAVFYMSTNALLLNDDISRALINSKITFLTISASVFNKDYSKIYRGGEFEDLERNIARLNELKKEAGSTLPRLRLSFVLRKDTLPYLDDALEFVKTHEFSEGIQLLSFFSYDEADRYLEPALDWQHYEKDIERFREKAKRESVPLDLSLDVLEGMRSSKCEDYTKECYEPWESFNVTPGGNTFACAGSGEVMGNIRESAPADIWNNQKFKKFRKGMNESPYNKDCAECWHCRYVSANVSGRKVSKLNNIYDTFYRRSRPAKGIGLLEE